MADEKIIKFGKLQEKWEEQDLEKFESFMNGLVEKFVSGSITMQELSVKIDQYRRENNISDEKMMKLQKSLVKKMGMDFGIDNIEEKMDEIEEKIKSDAPELKGAKKFIFKDYYKDRIEEKMLMQIEIKNKKNDLKMIFNGNNITIITEKKVDFSDNELNEIVANYKECVEGTLKIVSCEATKIYEYH